MNAYVQQDQPPGVSPLQLTGERTLPDVPAENYWFRRHLAVYEWIRRRVTAQRVLDMACGEGYGADVLAQAAASVVGVDANPEAYEHARARYRRPNLRFERGLAETFGARRSFDAVVFLQTIEHVHDPRAVLAHLGSILREGGVAYVSTPNVLTLAPRGQARSGNPWHLREYRAEEFDELCRSTFGHVQLLGLFHARKLRVHAVAVRVGWDAIHSRLGLTGVFYDRFIQAIDTGDFTLRTASLADRLGARKLHAALDLLAVCRL